MDRLIAAFFNSMRAFRVLARHEKAFQQELVLLAIALPAGWFLATSWAGFGLLIGVVLLLLLVEVMNTAVEAACNAVSREFDVDIRLAKDCGSLAVLIAAIIAFTVWAAAVAGRIGFATA